MTDLIHPEVNIGSKNHKVQEHDTKTREDGNTAIKIDRSSVGEDLTIIQIHNTSDKRAS
ncbi:MAG: hypothetical protein F6J89_18280 [Symploca sp. SIO1C4]|uniref:Uncharacterized protein n=1 Tax=Symploca sp. SIO1C4 TaxID=2607765 RepID=A0A6B3NHL8_9CYAN|nr:hypothetical protein [Symploca sp. SIO1C4]